MSHLTRYTVNPHLLYTLSTSITNLYFAVSYPQSKRRNLQAKQPSEGTWPRGISPIIAQCCCSLFMGTALFAVTPHQ